MIAYHGKPEVKDKYLARVLAQQKAGKIQKGVYWEKPTGIAVGCTIEGSNHACYESELGIPRQIALEEDALFSRMSSPEAEKLPYRFLEAVTVGADLSLVLPKFYIRLCTDKEHGAILKASPDGVIAIQRVVDLIQKLVDGKTVAKSDFLKAKAAAYRVYASELANATDPKATTYTSPPVTALVAYAAYAAASSIVTSWLPYPPSVVSSSYDPHSAYADQQKHYDWMAQVLLAIVKETK